MVSKENLTYEQQAEDTLNRIKDLKKKYTKKELWEMYQDYITDRCVEILGIELFDKQEKILRSKKHFIVVGAGRNTAKSYNLAFMLYRLIFFGLLFDFPIIARVGGPISELIKPVWGHLQDFLELDVEIEGKTPPLKEIFGDIDIRIKENANDHRVDLLIKKPRIEISSSSLNDSEIKHLRGMKFCDFIAIDEYGQCKYARQAKEVAIGALNRDETKSINRLYICGSPNDYTNESFEELLENPSPGKDIFHLSEGDNPYYDKESTEAFKDDLGEVAIQRELMGINVPPIGRMFEEFSVKTHIKPTPILMDKPLIIGIDNGFRKPAVIFMQYVNNIVRIPKELNFQEILAEELAKEIKFTLLTENLPDPVVVGVDKSAVKVSETDGRTAFQILKYHLQPIPTINNTNSTLTSKANQVDVLRALMKKNEIQIDPSCRKLIRSISKAKPDINKHTHAQKSDGWEKKKGIDDPIDALVYALICYHPTASLFLGKYVTRPKLAKIPMRKERQILNALGL